MRVAGRWTMAGTLREDTPVYFEILRSGSEFFWRIRGANHEVLAHSEMLTSKAACQNAIDVVKRGAASAPVYDRT